MDRFAIGRSGPHGRYFRLGQICRRPAPVYGRRSSFSFLVLSTPCPGAERAAVQPALSWRVRNMDPLRHGPDVLCGTKFLAGQILALAAVAGAVQFRECFSGPKRVFYCRPGPVGIHATAPAVHSSGRNVWPTDFQAASGHHDTHRPAGDGELAGHHGGQPDRGFIPWRLGVDVRWRYLDSTLPHQMRFMTEGMGPF